MDEAKHTEERKKFSVVYKSLLLKMLLKNVVENDDEHEEADDNFTAVNSNKLLLYVLFVVINVKHCWKIYCTF